jgi:integrase
VLFAAATGLRPGEWIALEQRDIDRDARVLYVRRAFRNGRIKCPKTEGSVRAVPLQAIALDALEQLPAGAGTDLLSASLTMIDRHYGHLARDGRDHAINLLDRHAGADEAGVHRVDIAWTLRQQAVVTAVNQNGS